MRAQHKPDRDARQRAAALLMAGRHNMRQIAGLTNLNLRRVCEVKQVMLRAAALTETELNDALQVSMLREAL